MSETTTLPPPPPPPRSSVEGDPQAKRLSEDLEAKLDVFINKLSKSEESVDNVVADHAPGSTGDTTTTKPSASDVRHHHPSLDLTKEEQKELAAVLVKTGNIWSQL